MAVLAGERFNMVEWSRKLHRGKILPEIEMLAQDNGVVDDIPWEQCNNGLSHLYSMVTSMPTVAQSAFNEGVNASHSTSAQETETTTMLTGLAEVDADMSEIGGAGGMVRAKEDSRFAEQLRQTCARLMIYGNRAANGARDIDGLSTRYNSLSGNKSKHVISLTGATANAQTSVYGVVWGDGAYGVVPEGTTAGYVKKDLGTYPKLLASGKTLIVKGTKHRWHIGLVLEDWRAAGRVCNIDVAHANAVGTTQAATATTNILHGLVQLKARLDRVAGRRVLYANDTVLVLLMRIAMEKSSAAISIREATTQFGTKVQQLYFLDYPIKRNDQILNTEAVVA